ncbi:hypothetical protein [Hirschia litorea]|uniref:Uncharacterized protein n=1 Tax=Hirschia litorea TaxID=1199156 RepID=A0ABW2IJD2_9PROT
MAKRVFSTVYSDDHMAPHVWLPLLLGSALGLAGLFLDTLTLTLSSAIFTVYAIWNWPFLDTRRVVLQLSNEGADIDGIGRIPWEAISQVELIEKRHKKHPPSENCTLRIHLNAAIEDICIPYAPMVRPNWQRKMISKTDAKTLDIKSGLLLDSQINIANAFAWFLTPQKTN